MLRLLDDANKLNAAQGKITNYSIENLGDVYQAIGVIQENLGIAGVAAAEAESTFSGSMGAMKASAQNFLASLTTGGDVKAAMTQLVSTTENFLVNNALPMIGSIVTSVPGIISQVVGMVISQGPTLFKSVVGTIGDLLTQVRTSIAALVPPTGMQAVTDFISGITTQLPTLLNKGVELVSGFVEKIVGALPEIQTKGGEMVTTLVDGVMSLLPTFMTAAGNLLNSLFEVFLANFPKILENGVQITLNLVNGIISHLPDIISAAVQIIGQLAATFAAHLPEILQKGVEIIMELLAGLLQAIPELIAGLPQIIQSIVTTFGQFDWSEIGHNIMEGIKAGILSKIDSVVEAAKNGAQRILDAAKGFLQIGSPSKVFAREVGRWIPEGIALGIHEHMGSVLSEMRRAADLTEMAYQTNVTAPDVEVNSASRDETLLLILQLLMQYFPEFAKNKGLSGSQMYDLINRQMGMAVL